MDIEKVNMMGGIVALTTLALCILVFVFRLTSHPIAEHWAGAVFLMAAIPLAYMLFTTKAYDRAGIYVLQVSLILVFIIIELLLDYVLKFDFRQTRWMLIVYVMLFFAGTGGLIGIASLAGKAWSLAAIILFLGMAFMAFWQHAKTEI